MRETLLALYRLQQVDSGALEFEHAAAKLPAKIAELEKSLDAQRSELGALRNEEDAKRQEQEATEGQIRDEGDKIQKWKRRLQEIKTPREYQALSREAEQLERLVKNLEEKVMTLMEEREAQKKVLAEREAEFREIEVTAQKQIRELREKEAQLRAQAAQAAVGREELLGSIKKKYLKQYERIRAARDGIGIVPTRGSACSGCHFEIRPQQMVEIRKMETIETCFNCSRILVHDSLLEHAKSLDSAAEASA